jgi:hypothetical protein
VAFGIQINNEGQSFEINSDTDYIKPITFGGIDIDNIYDLGGSLYQINFPATQKKPSIMVEGNTKQYIEMTTISDTEIEIKIYKTLAGDYITDIDNNYVGINVGVFLIETKVVLNDDYIPQSTPLPWNIGYAVLA